MIVDFCSTMVNILVFFFNILKTQKRDLDGPHPDGIQKAIKRPCFFPKVLGRMMVVPLLDGLNFSSVFCIALSFHL